MSKWIAPTPEQQIAKWGKITITLEMGDSKSTVMVSSAPVEQSYGVYRLLEAQLFLHAPKYVEEVSKGSTNE